MSNFDYLDPIITRLREGTSSDPYIDKVDTLQIDINSKVVLTEIPVKLNRVIVTGQGVSWVENQSESPLAANEFIVDYVNKIVTFHESRKGLQLTFSYKGRGLIYVPTSMIYTSSESGEVTGTLDKIIDLAEGSEQLLIDVEAATSAANQAAIDMTTLESAVEDAESLRVIVETSRIEAELERIADENARILSENSRIAAELVREDSESDRVSSESIRANAEIVRISDENDRIDSEIDRNNNESQRVSGETDRANAELQRVGSETLRIDAETERVTAETIRDTAETNRLAEETTRVTAETTRLANEITRHSNESNRVDAEDIRNDDEISRVSAEITRETQESARVDGEIERVAEEELRDDAETIRTSNEVNRVDTEAARVLAETSRSNAEDIRGSNETTRQSNEITRESNESTRESNETTRQTSEDDRVSEEIIRGNNETARQAAEIIRDSDESTRQSNETTRQTQESNRQTNTTSAINNLNSIKDSWAFKNTYSNTTSYAVNNIVEYNGSSYICIIDSTGNAPTNTTYWRIVAIKGQNGSGTVASITATNGDIIVGGTENDPTLTVNTGIGANQIVVRDTSGNIEGNISGNAATVTTNANLTGDVTSVGNETTLAGGIDATKLADGSVTNTEFQYLNGVTSSIQSQFDEKANLDSPTLIGSPTAPTAVVGTYNTQIANLQFVSDTVDAKFDANVVESEVEPTTGLYNGLIWYNPATDEMKMYLLNSFRSVGGSALASLRNTEVLADASDTVFINIPEFNVDRDILMVFQNSTYIEEGIKYEISEDGETITKISGTWENGTLFNFIAFKNVKDVPVNMIDASLIPSGAITNAKLAADVKVGSLSLLETTAKTDVVSAINDLKAYVDAQIALAMTYAP
jgi:hypothetical protein